MKDVKIKKNEKTDVALLCFFLMLQPDIVPLEIRFGWNRRLVP